MQKDHLEFLRIDWIAVAQDRDRWLVLVHVETNLQIP